MAISIAVEPHPLLEVGAFVTALPRSLGDIAAPPAIAAPCGAGAGAGATAPMVSSEAVKTAVRDLLRHAGFKPSGRSKPASEYLAAAFAEQRFPRINAVVDACNAVSLWSGLPISLVDADRLSGPLVIRAAPAGTSYVFNPSGQVIDASGLVCLYDGEGPTGTPVKDAQRTKTHDGSRRVLSIVWGTRALAGRTAEAVRWYRALVGAIDGAVIEDVTLAS
jgi:DNA/RNA-binding domain of Phe-tRNA-synthetase-like protein